MISVANWNDTLGQKYPVTIEDKGWIYGVWYCGTAYTKVRLHGQYPQGFLKRALALFPGVPEGRILHVPSGTLTGPGVTVDAIRDDVRCPQIVAQCDSLPFEDDRFSLILSDPPYTPDDSKKYGCKPWPMRKFLAEAKRVLEPDGILAILDTKYPFIRRADWKLIGLICVVTGAGKATRMFSLLKNKKTRLSTPATAPQKAGE